MVEVWPVNDYQSGNALSDLYAGLGHVRQTTRAKTYEQKAKSSGRQKMLKLWSNKP